MNGKTMRADPLNRPVPNHMCPGCGMAAPAVLAALPSGRTALVEACAVCGR